MCVSVLGSSSLVEMRVLLLPLREISESDSFQKRPPARRKAFLGEGYGRDPRGGKGDFVWTSERENKWDSDENAIFQSCIMPRPLMSRPWSPCWQAHHTHPVILCIENLLCIESTYLASSVIQCYFSY